MDGFRANLVFYHIQTYMSIDETGELDWKNM